MNGKLADTDVKTGNHQPPKKADNSFQDILKKSENLDNKEPSKATTKEKNTNTRNNNENKKEYYDGAQRTDHTRENTQLEKPKTNETKITETNKVDETTIDKPSLTEKEKLDEAKLAEIATLLGMTIDDVKNILEEMNISIDDLASEDSKAVIDFAVKLLGKEDSVDLLQVEGAEKLIKAIKDIATAPTIQEIQPDKELFQKISKDIQNMIKTSDKKIDTELETVNEDVVESSVMNKIFDDEPIIDDVEIENFITEETITINPTKQMTSENNMSGGGTDKNNFFDDFLDNISKPIDDISSVTNQNNMLFDKVLTERIYLGKTANTRESTHVMNQIISFLKVEAKPSETSVRMTLHPESLGDVQLKITTQNGIVTAQFLAETEKVKRILESNFTMLENALRDQGVSIASLSVSVGDGEQKGFDFDEGKSSGAGVKSLDGLGDVVSEEETEISEKSIEKLAKSLGSNVMYTA